jgi:predicted thioredoxin/glutaredoxin
MSGEGFLVWMLLEAKASREAMPVDPDVERAAVKVDDWWAHLLESVGEVLDDCEV